MTKTDSATQSTFTQQHITPVIELLIGMRDRLEDASLNLGCIADGAITEEYDDDDNVMPVCDKDKARALSASSAIDSLIDEIDSVIVDMQSEAEA